MKIKVYIFSSISTFCKDFDCAIIPCITFGRKDIIYGEACYHIRAFWLCWGVDLLLIKKRNDQSRQGTDN